jgi:glutathione S-transferase/pterin-4a-carbinolamine dehydratase
VKPSFSDITTTFPTIFPKSTKLYSHRGCPYAQRVCMAIEQFGVQIQKENISFENPPMPLKQINPNGGVPTLEFSPGKGIYESMVILNLIFSIFHLDKTNAQPEKLGKEVLDHEILDSQIGAFVRQIIYCKGNAVQLKSALEKLLLGISQNPQTIDSSYLTYAQTALAPFAARLFLVAEKKLKNGDSFLHNTLEKNRSWLTDLAKHSLTQKTLGTEADMPMLYVFSSTPAEMQEASKASRKALGQNEIFTKTKEMKEKLGAILEKKPMLISSYQVSQETNVSKEDILKVELQFCHRVKCLEFFQKISFVEDTLDHHFDSCIISYSSMILHFQTHEQTQGIKNPCLSLFDFKFAECVLEQLFLV